MTLDFIFLVITYLGGLMMVFVLSFFSLIAFWLHRHYRRMLGLVVSVIGSAISVFLLKHFFYFPRPEGAFYLETTSSFPSGHATLSMALYGFLVFSIYKHDKHPLKNKSIFLLTLIILFVGISRLYLEVHYPIDIVVGYLLGFIWICIANLISRRVRIRD